MGVRWVVRWYRPLGDRDGLIEYLIPPAIIFAFRNKQNNLKAADSKENSLLHKNTLQHAARENVLLRILLRDNC